jgi:hypothetical protein
MVVSGAGIEGRVDPVSLGRVVSRLIAESARRDESSGPGDDRRAVLSDLTVAVRRWLGEGGESRPALDAVLEEPEDEDRVSALAHVIGEAGDEDPEGAAVVRTVLDRIELTADPEVAALVEQERERWAGDGGPTGAPDEDEWEGVDSEDSWTDDEDVDHADEDADGAADDTTYLPYDDSQDGW